MVLAAAARVQLPVGRQQRERLDVGDQRGELQTTAVDVRSQRTTEADPIDPRLFFADGPRRGLTRLLGR